MADPRERPPLDAAAVESLARAARAARELCELLWEALHQELRDPREERVKELSQRLAEISSTVAMLTGGPYPGSASPERRSPPEPVDEVGPTPLPLGPAPPPGPGGPAPAPGGPAAPPGPRQPRPAAAQALRATDGETAHMRLVDEHEQSQLEIAKVAVKDVRREEGPSAWVNTVGRLLQRHTVDGLPFAVLLIEVVDVAAIERAESPVQVNNLIAQVEDALGRALRSEDELTRESFGRYWLVAPETNGTGARMLAERLARLVRSSASHRGVPLEVAVGIAVCPEDGTQAPTLAARADLGVYSARATGGTVARAEPPAS